MPIALWTPTTYDTPRRRKDPSGVSPLICWLRARVLRVSWCCWVGTSTSWQSLAGVVLLLASGVNNCALAINVAVRPPGGHGRGWHRDHGTFTPGHSLLVVAVRRPGGGTVVTGRSARAVPRWRWRSGAWRPVRGTATRGMVTSEHTDRRVAGLFSSEPLTPAGRNTKW